MRMRKWWIWLALACLLSHVGALAEAPEAVSVGVEAAADEAEALELFAPEPRAAANGAGFSDPQFDAWALANCDGDGDGMVSDAEALSVTEMDVSGLGIADMAGLERFANLTALNCANNRLTALDLSGNPGLTRLSCGGNPIAVLELGRCEGLRALVTSTCPSLSDGCAVFRGSAMYASLPADAAIWLDGAAFYDPAAPLTLTAPAITIGVKQAVNIVSPESGCPAAYCQFATSKKKYVTVTEEGVVKGVKAGNAVITATAFNGKSAQCAVKVAKAPSKVTLSPKTLTLGEGEAAELTAALPANTMTTLAWTSSAPEVASVSDGRVEALSPGKATVTVTTANGKKASCAVTVRAAPAYIQLERYELPMMVRETAKIAVVLPEGAYGAVRWSVIGEAVTVDADTGLITAVAEGMALVTATTYNGKTADCLVTVTPGPEAVVLSESAVTLGVGQSLTLRAEAVDADGVPTGHSLSYVAGNAKYAVVTDDGVVTGRKKGNTTVTVSAANGVKAVCRVKVIKAPSSLKLDRTSLKLALGERYTLKATPAAGITWSGFDRTVVDVDADGTVTAVGEGRTTVTASTYNGKTAACAVTVGDAAEEPEEPVVQPTGLIAVAHRGGRGYWEENTLEAFSHSASKGADMIEMDVQTTSDGVQVIHHDASFKAGGKTYKIPKKTYATLKAAKPSLCTLDEALEVIYGTGLLLQLELKESADARKCVQAIQASGMAGRTWYISFKTGQLEKVRKIDSTARLGYIFSGSVPKKLYSTVQKLNIAAVMVEQKLLTKERVDEWHRAGLLVNAWTINNKADCRTFARMGVDFITSDYPDYAAAAK